MNATFRQPARRGASATELAILLPLILAFCIATVDLGRFAFALSALYAAVNAGADYGATRTYTAHAAADWEDACAKFVRDEMELLEPGAGDDVAVDISVSDLGDDLHLVTIAASYPFATIITWPGIDNPILLRAHLARPRFR